MAKAYAKPVATEKAMAIFKEFKSRLRALYSSDIDPAFLSALLLTLDGAKNYGKNGSVSQRFVIEDDDRIFYIQALHNFDTDKNGKLILIDCDFELTIANGRTVASGSIEFGQGEMVQALKVNAATKEVETVMVPFKAEELSKALGIAEFDEYKVSGMVAFVDANAAPIAKYKVDGVPLFNDAIFLYRNEDGEFESTGYDLDEFKNLIN